VPTITVQVVGVNDGIGVVGRAEDADRPDGASGATEEGAKVGARADWGGNGGHDDGPDRVGGENGAPYRTGGEDGDPETRGGEDGDSGESI
jgi:hypothetical protein